MLAKLTVYPLRSALAPHRSWTRALHNCPVSSSAGNSTHPTFLDGSHTAFQDPRSNNAINLTKQQGLKSTEDVDDLMERLFQRAVPVPHGSVHRMERVFQRSQVTAFDPLTSNEELQVMNRNARRPRKANKGARPCSRASRRKKKEKIGKRGR